MQSSRKLGKAGGVIKASDFSNFLPVVEDPVTANLAWEERMFSTPQPTGGLIAAFILSIVSKFRKDGQLRDDNQTAHIMVEAFKFGFAQRYKMGDLDKTKMQRVSAYNSKALTEA